MSNKEASCARCEQVMMWGGGGRSWPGRMDCWVWVRAPAVNTEIGGQHYSKQISTLTAAGQDRAGSHEGLVLIYKKYYLVPPRAVLEQGSELRHASIRPPAETRRESAGQRSVAGARRVMAGCGTENTNIDIDTSTSRYPLLWLSLQNSLLL